MRKMTLGDYEEVYSLWKGSKELDVNDIDESYVAIGRYLERNPDTCFVEERDGRIVGVIMGGHDSRRGSIHHLLVKEDYRKQGIGKRLVDTCIDALRKQGIRRIGLFVYNDNSDGRDFWERQGLEIRNDIVYMDKDI